MKYNVQNLALLSAVITFASCESHKKSTIDDSGTEVVKVRTPSQDTLNKEAVPEMKTKTIQGTVVDINRGKDGYTAKIETPAMTIVAATISRSNLKDPEQYKEVRIGENLNVTGDYWKLGKEDQITVREIHQ
jgi:hypothetical protein